MNIKKWIHTSLLAVIGSSFVWTACTKEITEEQYGAIQGHIQEGEYYAELVHESCENVTIRLESGPWVMETRSGADGRYQFNQIPIGTYNLSFQKEGFGKYIYYGFQVAGGQLPVRMDDVLMSELPTHQLTKLTVEPHGYRYYEDRSYLEFKVNYEQLTSQNYLVLLSQDSNLNLWNYEQASFHYFYRESGVESIKANYSDYPAGSTWYMKIIPCNLKLYYLHPDTGKPVYYCANEDKAIVTSFVVPEPQVYE